MGTPRGPEEEQEVRAQLQLQEGPPVPPHENAGALLHLLRQQSDQVWQLGGPRRQPDRSGRPPRLYPATVRNPRPPRLNPATDGRLAPSSRPPEAPLKLRLLDFHRLLGPRNLRSALARQRTCLFPLPAGRECCASQQGCCPVAGCRCASGGFLVHRPLHVQLLLYVFTLPTCGGRRTLAQSRHCCRDAIRPSEAERK